MRHQMYLSILAVGLGIACSSQAGHIREERPGLAAQAAIDASTARRAALERTSGGTIEDAVLETEKGRLVYSFDIQVPDREGIEEVQVDAMTGAVVSVEHEDEAMEGEGEAARPETGEGVTAIERPELRSQATISDEEARGTALARVPGGRIVKAELEEEDGVLMYSFDIRVEGKPGIEEVHVDARTGAVLRQEHEGAD